MISGNYIRSRLTKLITDRINVFSNQDLDVSDQYYTNEFTERIYAKERQNPQMEYNWVVRLPDIYTEPTDSVSIRRPPNYEAPDFSIGVEEIEHRIDSITVPYDTFEIGKHTDGSSFWFSAQKGEVGTITLVVDEFEDGASLSFFQHWMALIRNNDGTHNPPAFYKKNIGVYDINSLKLDTHATVLGGFFPVSIEQTGRSQNAQGVMQYTVTLAGDAVNHIRIPPETVLQKIDSEQQNIVDSAIDANGVLTNAPNLFVEGLDKAVGLKNIIF